VMPPSIHPDSGWPYLELVDAPIVDPPAWLVKLIVVPHSSAACAAPRRERTTSEKFLAGAGSGVKFGESVADSFTDNTSWHDVLEPHGWVCLDADGDADGARWLHPAATSKCSATITNGCLFVYSTSTEFEPTAVGDPNGYTKFRAYAVLEFSSDLKAAARSLRRSA
jgi:hypothetical protein